MSSYVGLSPPPQMIQSMFKLEHNFTQEGRSVMHFESSSCPFHVLPLPMKPPTLPKIVVKLVNRQPGEIIAILGCCIYCLQIKPSHWMTDSLVCT